VALLWLLLGACTGARGIQPGGSFGPFPETEAPTTIVGPVSAPRFVLTEEPVAVPSTTTTLPAPEIPDASGGITAPPAPAPTATVATLEAPPPAPAATSIEPLPGTVALTFDDGPFDEWTETILETLAAHDVNATFFVSTYRLPELAHLIPQIVEAGHSVQTHGDHHDDLTAKTEDEIRIDLITSIQKLVEAGAPRPTCFRPPYGATNDLVNQVAADLDLQVVGWSLNTLDYSLQDAQQVIDTMLTHVRPGDNVLAHDQWAPVWEEALPVVITELRARGIGFSPICVTAVPDGA